ncbi:hypothetical protein ACHAW5_006824 [Stephanodiscus triporus]|uniref:JmjC domain-containing protein n=1 Tax=Stephanodiscus triporus TaxID=2934178 RepID=A0ABD3PYJ5_9STRA
MQKRPPSPPLAAATRCTKRKSTDQERPSSHITNQLPPKAAKSSVNIRADTFKSSTPPDAIPPINQYNGWAVPTKEYNLPTIDIADVTPEIFYTKYIQCRRPVVLKGVLPDDLSLIEQWKDFNYLLEKVGDQSVMVEKRSSDKESFGKGNEIKMSFRRFLHLIIDRGDDRHYLTTQDVEANSDGRPDLMSPLMKSLKNDFPLRPVLMGNLVPQNINMWIGNSKDGTSSGLHHDYHDNLYIVLKGRKRFRLYSPLDTEKMYTKGELARVHPNGRINYKREETTAYGADLLSDAAALAAKQRGEAEKRLYEAELAMEEGKPGAHEQLERAEQELEKAIDAVLDAEMCEDDDESESGSYDDQYEYGDRRRIVDKTVKNPNNFSNVEASCLNDEEKLKQKYPRVLHANAAFCDIEAGSILYLPASWFHEVTSYGASLALNYWFHPPDGHDFMAPYSTGFWPNDYSERFGDC